jgi:hypothetical protein
MPMMAGSGRPERSSLIRLEQNRYDGIPAETVGRRVPRNMLTSDAED